MVLKIKTKRRTEKTSTDDDVNEFDICNDDDRKY